MRYSEFKKIMNILRTHGFINNRSLKVFIKYCDPGISMSINYNKIKSMKDHSELVKLLNRMYLVYKSQVDSMSESYRMREEMEIHNND